MFHITPTPTSSTITTNNSTPLHPSNQQQQQQLQQQQLLYPPQQQSLNINTSTTNYPAFPQQQQQQQQQLPHLQQSFNQPANVFPTNQTLHYHQQQQQQQQQQQPSYLTPTQFLPQHSQQPQQRQPQPQFAPGYLMNVGQGKPLSALPVEFLTPAKKSDSPWSTLSPRVPSANARPNSPSSYSFGFGEEDGNRSRSPLTAEGGVVMEDAPPTESLYDMQTDSPNRDGAMGGMTAQQMSPRAKNLRSPHMRYDVEQPSSDTVFEAASRANDGLTSAAVTESVIVFGFPSSATSYVLSQFRNYGDIVSYKTSPNGGNWMTITYSTRLAAQMALAKNGRVYGNVLMIGVLPAPEDGDDSSNQYRIRGDGNDADGFAVSRNNAVASGTDASTSNGGVAAQFNATGVRTQTARVVQNASIFKTSNDQSHGVPVESGSRGSNPNREASKANLASSGVYQKISDALWGW